MFFNILTADDEYFLLKRYILTQQIEMQLSIKKHLAYFFFYIFEI